MNLKFLFLILSFLNSIFGFINFPSNLNVNDIQDVILCAKKIANRYVGRYTIVVFEEESNSPYYEEFLKSIKIPKMITNFNDVIHEESLFFLFPTQNTTYRYLFHKIKHENSKFVILWNESTSINDGEEIYENFWKNEYLSVITLVKNNTIIDILTYFPYKENNECNSIKNDVIEKYDTKSRNFLFNIQNLFSTYTKTKNLHNCPLKCIGNNEPPDSIMKFDQGRWTASGVGITILKIMEKYLNFTAQISSLNYTLNSNVKYSWYVFQEELKNISILISNQKYDIAFGWYAYVKNIHDKEIYNDDIELTRATSIDCVGWAVPYRAGPKNPAWTNYLYEFAEFTWLIIGVTFLVTIFVFYLISKIFENYFQITNLITVSYKLHLEQPNKLHHESSYVFRLFFITLCWYCLVITAAYKASLGSFLTVPSHGSEFVHSNDILHSSLRVCGSDYMFKILNSTATKGGHTEQLVKRFHVLPLTDFEKVMEKLIKKRNIAVLGIKRFLYYHSISQAKRLKVRIPLRFLPGCLLRSYTTQFMFKKGSHLLKTFNKILTRLFESGIVSHSVLHLGSNTVLPLEKIKGRRLVLKYFLTPFYVLFFGYIISTFAFVIEIIIYRQKIKSETNSKPLPLKRLVRMPRRRIIN